MRKEKNKEEFSFFDHLRNVDEQRGIYGKNVIFKSLATNKEKDVAIVAELKKEKIKLPDNQFARKVFSWLLFIENAHSAGDLFDKSQHELERIMMANRLLTFRLDEKIKSLKY